jgi:hypothetical protein
MRMYKIAIASSLMYYLDTEESFIKLTPDPFRAISLNEDDFPVYQIKAGKYYDNPNIFDISNSEIEELKAEGFLGIILGEDLIVFDKSSLTLFGEYKVDEKKIIKK